MSDWGFEPKKQKQKDEWGKGNKSDRDLFISNFPLKRSMDAVLSALSALLLRKVGAEPTFVEKEVLLDGIRVRVPNHVQYKAVLECNGAYIFNQPIWIVKLPLQVGKYTTHLATIFSRFTSNGQVDLSNLKDKLMSCGIEAKELNDANFDNRDFVEFLFFRLGSESRDKRFHVDTLLLNGNNIQNPNLFSTFLTFLPTLHRLVLNDNPIRNEQALDWPYVEVVCERKVSKQKALWNG